MRSCLKQLTVNIIQSDESDDEQDISLKIFSKRIKIRKINYKLNNPNIV